MTSAVLEMEDENELDAIGGRQVGSSEWVAEDYLHGGCNKLAIVLAQMTGLKIGGLFISDIDMDDAWCLTHAFCMLGDTHVVDAAGVRTLEDVKDLYAFNERFDDFSNDCEELIVGETAKRNYAAFQRGERHHLRAYIRQYLLPEIAAYNERQSA